MRTTIRTPSTIGARRSGRRCSGRSVSGSRNAHTLSTVAAAADAPNTSCHGPIAVSNDPNDGAITGARMNIAITVDITRAIWSPR